MKLYVVNTVKQLTSMLSHGRVDAIAESKWVDNYVWSKMGLKADDLIIGPNVGEIKYIYLGAGLNFPPELTNQIKKAMLKVEESGVLENIMNKYN